MLYNDLSNYSGWAFSGLSPLPKIFHTYLKRMRLGTVISCLRNSVNHPLSSAGISAFLQEINDFCYIKKYRYRFACYYIISNSFSSYVYTSCSGKIGKGPFRYPSHPLLPQPILNKVNDNFVFLALLFCFELPQFPAPQWLLPWKCPENPRKYCWFLLTIGRCF